MNNFNAIFSTIKECDKKGITKKSCYKKLATMTEHPNFLGLDFYLENLEGLGLITYDKKRKIVMLTEKGQQADGLFLSFAP